MSCFNFIIMKVNGADVSNLPYEEAVQLFLNAEEPILVEVRRRCLDECNKLNLFNYDINKSPTLAVIATSNTPNLYDGVEFCKSAGEASTTIITAKHSTNEKPSKSSISCQTELSAFDSSSKDINFIKGGSELDGGTFIRKKQEHTSAVADTIDGCLKTEFDIEEITLKKSQSVENLGFTISYSTEDFNDCDSCSDESIDECNDADGKDEGDDNLIDFGACRCKIYVSDILPNSLADLDGRLRQGDRILQINGQNVLGKVDPNKLLTESKHSVTILVSRYAYAGEDDFLDSAVYCDDKEYQDDRHLSSICECEQNTVSSKSSIAQSEQTSCIPTTVTNIYPILPIEVEKVSDLFNHASIKAQLESVNKEISLLNSQISVMKLQQLQPKSQPSLEKQSSPFRTKEKPSKTTKNKSVEPQTKAIASRLKSNAEVEHIYETIPEDTESDAYYCSPYEGVNELRVEQWLKSIGCTKSDTTAHNPLASRLLKQNPNIDDYDNSSSAYNTGGSCNSALLSLDQKSKLPNNADNHNSKKLPSKCIHVHHDVNSLSQNESKNRNTLAASGKPTIICRNPNLSNNEKLPSSSCVSHRTLAPSTFVPMSSHCATDIDSDGHSTLVAKSSVYTMCQYKVADDYMEDETSQMVWKVKRRPDGTRYIVRRVIKKCQPSKKKPDTAANQVLHHDLTETIGYKRQAHRLHERRHRHKNSATPSKEKHHSQHWLV